MIGPVVVLEVEAYGAGRLFQQAFVAAAAKFVEKLSGRIRHGTTSGEICRPREAASLGWWCRGITRAG
jgi:hypothetical protein